MSRKTNIFAIYAWEDKNALLQIRQSLRALEANESVHIWADDPILPGQEWKPKVESRMEFADVFLLLVSTDFMNSKFIQQIDFKNVIDKYKANDAVVIPVLVDDCQWQIDFKSDEYDFNLNELQVLPDQKNPIENWELPEEAFETIGSGLKKVIADLRGESVEVAPIIEEINPEVEEIVPVKNVEDQLELSFFDELDTKETSIAAQNRDAEAERLLEEAAAKKRVAEEEKRAAEAEAQNKANILARQNEAAEKEAQRKAAIEKQNLAEQEAKINIEKEKQLKIQAEKLAKEQTQIAAAKEAELKADQEKLFQEELQAKKRAAEVQRAAAEAKEKAKIEAERQLIEEENREEAAEEERILLEQAEANRAYQNHEENYEEELAVDEPELEDSTSSKKSLLILAGVLLLAVAFYIFYDSDGDTKEIVPIQPETNTEVVEDAMSTEDTEVISEADEETIVETPEETVEEETVVESSDERDVAVENTNFSDIKIGDSYAGGIVFEIDKSNNAAKIAQTKDAGPMSWKSAMKINEQLGDGWRLPTQDELKLVYNTIGKGGNNSGGFAEELYWSSTLYQKIQSRMVRFSDGNTSFHYSNVRESRKFRVRAIKEISE